MARRGARAIGSESALGRDHRPSRRQPYGGQYENHLALGRLVERHTLDALQYRIAENAASFGYVALRQFAQPGLNYITYNKIRELAGRLRPGSVRYGDPDELLEAMKQNVPSVYDVIPLTGHVALTHAKSRTNRVSGQRLSLSICHPQPVSIIRSECETMATLAAPGRRSEVFKQYPDAIPAIHLLDVTGDGSGESDIEGLLAASLPLPDRITLGRLTTFQYTTDRIEE